MSDLRRAAEQALEAMDNLHRTGDTQVFDLCHRETTEALRAALAEPEQEPLTDEVVQQLYAACCPALYQFKGFHGGNFLWLVRIIEQAHGIGGKDEQ